MGPDAFVFQMLSFNSNFSLSSFIFIKRLFSSSSLSAIRVVSSAYLRVLIFLLAILIPVYPSSSLTFHMMYSACKLNKQGDNMQPYHTPFPIWNESFVPCPALTDASWPAHRILKRQVWYSQLFKNLPQFIVIHTIKGFGVVNKAEVDVSLELFRFFYDPTDVDNLRFGSYAFSKSRISGSSQFVYCWSFAWRILNITLLACEMSTTVW